MGTFFLRWPFKCSPSPRARGSHSEPFHSTAPQWLSLLGRLHLVKMCPVYKNETVTSGWLVPHNVVWHSGPAAPENRLVLHLFFQRQESLKTPADIHLVKSEWSQSERCVLASCVHTNSPHLAWWCCKTVSRKDDHSSIQKGRCEPFKPGGWMGWSSLSFFFDFLCRPQVLSRGVHKLTHN